MKTYTETELKEILNKHYKWLLGQDSGEQADLSYANLRYADLSYANLSSANLSSANLSSANLSSANLSYANLRYADLSYANLSETLLSDINWLSWIGIVPIDGKARAYKIINKAGEGIYNGGINYLKAEEFIEENIDRDINRDCGAGINLATFRWCLNAKNDDSHKLLLMEFEVNEDNMVCPIASDGKFRVKHCKKIGECDWHGNLLTDKPKRKRSKRANP